MPDQNEFGDIAVDDAPVAAKPNEFGDIPLDESNLGQDYRPPPTATPFIPVVSPQPDSPADTQGRSSEEEWSRLPPWMRNLADVTEPRQPGETGLQRFGKWASIPVGALGTSVGLAGKGLEAVIGNVTGTGDTLNDVAESIRIGKKMPVEAAAAKIPGVGGAIARGGLGIAETVPKLAVLALFPESILVQSIAAGGIFGLDAQGNFSVKGAAIGALLPGAGALAKAGVARAFAKGIESGGSAVLKNGAAQWITEEIGQQAALNAVMIGGESKELIAAYKRDPEEARNMIQEMVGNNLAWALFGGARHFLSGAPTATQTYVKKNAEKYGDYAYELLTAKMSGDEKAIYDAVQKSKKSQARMPGERGFVAPGDEDITRTVDAVMGKVAAEPAVATGTTTKTPEELQAVLDKAVLPQGAEPAPFIPADTTEPVTPAPITGSPNASEITSPEGLPQPEIRPPVGQETRVRQPGEVTPPTQPEVRPAEAPPNPPGSNETVNENGSVTVQATTKSGKTRSKFVQTKNWTNDYGKTFNKGVRAGDVYDWDNPPSVEIVTSGGNETIPEENREYFVSEVLGENQIVLGWREKTNPAAQTLGQDKSQPIHEAAANQAGIADQLAREGWRFNLGDRTWRYVETQQGPAPAPPVVPPLARAAMTLEEHEALYPVIKSDALVDGREQLNPDRVPNMSSIGSSIDNPKVLHGIREVPMSHFPGINGRHYSVEGQKKIDALVEEIKASGQISPLIVVIDSDGPYVLEGSTRIDALFKLGAKSFPAKVVLDIGDIEKPKVPVVPTVAPVARVEVAAKPGVVSPATLDEPVSPGGYKKRGLKSAIEMRQREPGGSMANYDAQSQGEWLDGKPSLDGKVTLYRATQTGEPIGPGDYVTNSKPYAQQHIDSNLGGKGKITSIEATLDDIYPADGPKEFWYSPKGIENPIPSVAPEVAPGKSRPLTKILEDLEDAQHALNKVQKQILSAATSPRQQTDLGIKVRDELQPKVDALKAEAFARRSENRARPTAGQGLGAKLYKKAAIAEEEKQFIVLTRDIDRKTKGTEPLPPSKLEKGYKFTLKGTEVTVERIEIEGGQITGVVLSDGDKYGVHRVPIGEGRWELRMDVGSLKVPEPKPVTPKLPPGVNQGDLIASTQREDLNLVGDKGADVERLAKEKAAAKKLAEEAAALEAQQQQNLFKPAVPEKAAEPISHEAVIRKLLMADPGEMSGAQKGAEIRRLAKERGVTVKQMQEEIETSIVKLADEIVRANYTPEQKFGSLVGLLNRQPTLSARTSTSVADQAYSTPAPLSFALGHAIDVRPGTTIYEPTAGNGMLMIGSKLDAAHGNEMNPARAESLRKFGVGTVTENDATKYTPTGKFDAVLANPPFGSIDNVNYGGYGIKRLEHLIALRALEAMSDDGKAAIILGAKREAGESGKGAQWVFENYLYGHYNVVGNFEVEGDLYAKQGASWPVRCIVVDGRRIEPIGGVLAPKTVDRFTTWDDVWKESNRIRYEIELKRQAVGASGEAGLPVRTPGQPTAPGEPGTIPEPAIRPPEPTGKGIQPGREGLGKPTTGGRPATTEPRQPPIQPLSRPEDEPPTGEQPGTGRKPAERVEAGPGGSPESPADAGTAGARGSAGTKPRIVPQPPTLAGTEHQSPYEARSKGNPFGTLTPKSVAGGTFSALDELQARVGPVDEFVSNRLNMTPDELRTGLAAEQIDGVALGIDQLEQGGALIIGDETGIGKGRQGAALIRYGKIQGKTPIFFTADPKLFTDMYGDLLDIGTAIKPFIMGDTSKASIVDAEGNKIHNAPGSARQKSEMARIEEVGLEAAGYDSIFATYSQINTRNARQLFLERLANDHDVIIVLDEAHQAAGDAETSMQAAFISGGRLQRGSGPEQHIEVLPGLLNARGSQKGRGGVVYMSATYAKRSENMPVYFRTSLSKAADSFKQIVSAMKKGGIALQQAVSEALSGAGQYIRRERDFTGVTYAMKKVVVKDQAKLVDHVDQVTDVLSEIVRFSQQMREAVLAEGESTSTAMTESAIDMTDFASIVHNQVGQLLLAAKADAIIEEAIAAHKAGEKPVIAVMNTMGAFLDHFTSDKGIRPGSITQIRWNELLKHALERSLRTTEDMPDGSTVIGRADPEQFGLGELYRGIQKAADGIESNFTISPIDYIIQKLAQAGIKMGELTGRESGIEYTDFETGEGIYRKFKKANKNSIVNRFNSGEYEGMLLNASGSTGLSAHASEKFKDQKPRHMIIGQAALDINVFVQTLGRIKRTGMVLRGIDAGGKPYGAKYTHLVLPLQAELRPAAMAARKMKSLNANTTAEADNSIKIEAEDMFNKYGDRIVAEYLDEHHELQASTGLSIERNDDGSLEVPPDIARRLTGRMAIRPDSEQQTIYESIIPAYHELVDQLKATGEYDLEVAVHSDWDAKRKSDEELVAGTDERNIFTASVRVQQWEIKDNRHVPTGEEMREEFERKTGGAPKLGEAWQEAQTRIENTIAQRRANLEQKLAAETKEPEQLTIRAQLDTLGGIDQRWNDTRQATHHIIFDGGKVIELVNKETGDAYEGVLVDVKMPTSGMRVSASNFKFKFLVDAPGGVLYLTAHDFMGGTWTKDRSSKDFGDLTGKKTGARYDRYFIVGNPIRGYEATGGLGRVVRFTSEDGKVITGLLMPNNWGMEKLVKDPRLDLVNGKAAQHFLRTNAQGYGYGTGPAIEALGGIVKIHKAYGSSEGFVISVPSAKRTGGAIYLDKPLLRLTGDFTKVGSKMTAEVNVEDLPKVIDQIAEITKSRFRATGNAEDLIPKVAESNRKGNLGKSKQGMLAEQPGLQATMGGQNVTITPPTEFGKKALPAFHGTPHEVDRFSTSKIGTGEGAQAYGYGLYFADRPEVAENYAIMKGADYAKPRELAAAALYDYQGKAADAIDALKKGYNFAQTPNSTAEAIRILESGERPTLGNKYTVDILSKPEEMIDWDKPFSEQNPQVQRALETISKNRFHPSDTGGGIYWQIQSMESGLTPKDVSEMLSKAGIQGIRYLDQGSRQNYRLLSPERSLSRKWSVGDPAGGPEHTFDTESEARAFMENAPRSYNYVIFDESKIRITHKNGQEVSVKQAMLEAGDERNPTGKAPVELQSVEQLRQAVRENKLGLSPEATKLINAFLDSKMAKALDGVRFKIADTLEGGYQGSYFEGLVELARTANPETGPHEFGHRLWELLPKEVTDQFEAMRVAAINDRLSKPANAFQIPILEDLRDNPIYGGQDFRQRGYGFGRGRELYHLASDEEFFTHSLSKAFHEKVDAKGAGLITRMKDFVIEMVSALRKTLGLNQTQDQMLRNIMAGRYKISPETGIAVERNKQASIRSKGPTPEELASNREKENNRQWFGTKLGEDHEAVKLRDTIKAVRMNGYNGQAPVTEGNTKLAFDIFENATNRDTRQAYMDDFNSLIGHAAAGSALRNELHDYAWAALLKGDDRLFKAMISRVGEFETGRWGDLTGLSLDALNMRMAQEADGKGLRRSMVEYVQQQMVAANRTLGTGQKLFDDIIRAINDISGKIDPVEWDRIILTGKDSEGRTLADIIASFSPERKAAEEIVEKEFPVKKVVAAKRGGILETVHRWMGQETKPSDGPEFIKGLYNELLDRFTLSEEQANRVALQTWVRKDAISNSKVQRELDAELRRYDNEAENAAKSFISKWAKSAPQRDQERLADPMGYNLIKKIIAESLKDWNVPSDYNDIIGLRTKLAHIFVENGLSEETADRLSKVIWEKKETDWTNARTNAMEKASKAKSVTSIIEAIRQSPYRAQNDPEWRRETARQWFLSNGLSPEDAAVAAKRFDHEFQRAYALATEKIAQQLLRGKEPRTIEQLVAAVRSGLLDPHSDWTAKLATGLSAPEMLELTDLQLKSKSGKLTKPEEKRFGVLLNKSREKFRPLMPDQLTAIAKLEEQLSKPDLNPYVQTAIVEQIMGIMRHAGDQTGHFWKAAGESFSASLLSGIKTMTLQVGQPALFDVLAWGVHSASQPKDFVTLTRAALEAVKNFTPEFANAWEKDASAFSQESAGLFRNELKRQFEIAQREWGEGGYGKAILRFAYGWQHYIMRTFSAFDQATMAVRREWSMALYGSMAMRAAGFTTRQIAEMVNVVSSHKQAAYADYQAQGMGKMQARAASDHDAAIGLRQWFTEQKPEGKHGKFPGVDAAQAERVYASALAEAFTQVGRRAPGVTETAEGLASQPMNRLMEIITKIRGEGGMPSIMTIMAVGFVNVPFRSIRYAAGWGPYGILRYGIHSYMQTNRPGAAGMRRYATKLNKGEETSTFWNQSYKNEMMAKARLREALVGTGLMLAFYAWQHKHSTADDDIEKKPFAMFTTGAGPLNKTMRDSWTKRGFQPYSLHVIVNGQVRAAIPIIRTGEVLGIPLGLAAAVDDVAWKRKQNAALGRPAKDPASQEILQGIATYYNIFGAQGIFQAFGHVSQLSQAGGGMGRAIGTTAAGLLSGMVIPGKSLLSGVTEMIYGPVDRSDLEASMWSAVPIVGAMVNGKAVNRFGDTIGDRSWYGKLLRLGAPIAFRVDDTPQNREMYQMILDKGTAPPELRRSLIENQYGRPLNQAEWNRFSQISGGALKTIVNESLNDLKAPDTPSQSVHQFLVKAADMANAQAAESLGLERVPTASQMAAGSGGGSGGSGNATSLPKVPGITSLGLPQVPGGAGRTAMAGAGFSSSSPASSPASAGSAGMGLGTRLGGSRRVGLGGGRTRRVGLGGLRQRKLRFVTGRLRARSGRIRRIGLYKARKVRRITFKG